jgi:hypothetical protein
MTFALLVNSLPEQRSEMMSHSSRLDALRRIFSFGLRHPHNEKQGPDYRQAEPSLADGGLREPTPPIEARTDPDRGTGELGEGEVDPDRPLPEAGTAP